ncbi:T4 beta protein [Collimonas sp. PA-H2]|uniref:beta family protein n=1 Tax=Collimonas sp. PA-H2 TaxID=1881062 RepID=UPI000BF5D78F|nr:beta family protein [Collimonas sp. PA-H2]PFH08805.1 T4 beta protein [Collimonas sp. PA-H2]
MDSRSVYVPLVKGKKNDLMAVGRVNNDVRQLMKPFIEAMPINPKAPLVEEHVFKLCEYIRKHLPLGEIFVDFHGLMPDATISDGTNATLHGFALLKAFGRSVTPAYGFERNDDLWDTLGAIARDFDKGFCFRLSRDDLAEYLFDDVWAQIIERTAQMRLPQNKIDLLLDLRHIDGEDTSNLAENIVSFLFHNPNIAGYRSIVIAGSSALKTVGSIEKNKVGEVIRQELRLWSALWRDMPDTIKPTFGDYGIIHPDFSDQTTSRYVNAKIRYTAGDKIIYFRGHALHHPIKDYDQYHDLASRVSADFRYVGRTRSFGDTYIDDCARRLIKPGSLATWVIADMNHHVCYTARQLARLTQQLASTVTESEAEIALSTV